MGAYFLKKQARSPILEGFGRNIYALLSFSGQQYSLIVSFLLVWVGGGHFWTRKVICGQKETTCHSVLYICTSEEKRSIDKNKYIGYGNSDD